MSRSNIMMAVTAGISLLVPLAPSAADAAAVPEFTVQVLGTNGSGCPADPASSVTADVLVGGTITLRYQNFTVYGGDYKTCVVFVNVAAPAGWTYAVPSIENVAWAELDADASARIATNAWFTGYSWTVTDARKVDGPLYNYWETTSTPETPQWAPCGESFNLNVAVTTRVDGPPSNTVSLLATNIGRPTWRQC